MEKKEYSVVEFIQYLKDKPYSGLIYLTYYQKKEVSNERA